MLNPSHLQTLQEVLRSNSFAMAANRLGYTASAVSQQMASLERSVGVVLFERSARRIYPTPAAHVLARMGAKVLFDLEGMPSAIAQVDNMAPRQVGLGIFPSAALQLLPHVLGSDTWRNLNVEMTIQVAESSELIEMLLNASSVDLALVYQFGRSSLAWPDALRARTLVSDPLVVLMPTTWAEEHGPSPALLDLAPLPWISNVFGTAGALAVDRIWNQRGASIRVVGRCDDYAVTTELVRMEVGAALVPSMVTRALPTGVTVLRPVDLEMSREVLALTRKGISDPSLATVEELFVAALGLAGQSDGVGGGRG